MIVERSGIVYKCSGVHLDLVTFMVKIWKKLEVDLVIEKLFCILKKDIFRSNVQISDECNYFVRRLHLLK